MKGLLIKDIRLIKSQKKILILYFFISIMLSFTMDHSFIVSYFPMVGLMLVLSTIAYDNHDNGQAFLMTMPVRAGDYAVSKYIFSVLGLFCVWAFAIVMQFVSLIIRKIPFNPAELFMEDFMILPVFFLIVSIMIPIEFKYSSERSKIVLFIIFGICFLIIIAGKAAIEFVSGTFNIDINGILDTLDALSPVAVIIALYALCVVMLSISLVISIRIMQKKEF